MTDLSTLLSLNLSSWWGSALNNEKLEELAKTVVSLCQPRSRGGETYICNGQRNSRSVENLYLIYFYKSLICTDRCLNPKYTVMRVHIDRSIVLGIKHMVIGYAPTR